MVVLWLSFGIHLVVNRVVTDVCLEVDLVLADPNTLDNPGSICLSALMSCAKNESQFYPLLDLTKGTFDRAIEGGCGAIQVSFCANNIVECLFTKWKQLRSSCIFQLLQLTNYQ